MEKALREFIKELQLNGSIENTEWVSIEYVIEKLESILTESK